MMSSLNVERGQVPVSDNSRKKFKAKNIQFTSNVFHMVNTTTLKELTCMFVFFNLEPQKPSAAGHQVFNLPKIVSDHITSLTRSSSLQS